MGYGEFGGGGSVGWVVRHGSGTVTGTGIDPDPTHGQGGRFRVYVNGLLVADVAADDARVVVAWGRHATVPPTAPDPPATNNARFVMPDVQSRD